ncbi:type I methionyl aminopeptidase [Holophaga foetida]|uniref:type I methionyl aminopeptidase n=1 Tax=Holophaga foetida TaxID=35839 RepID=UPI0002475320|nr:type I methionyl aminopeptidase [Holophaga foetida]
MVAIRERIKLKSKREIEKMREAGRLTANALRMAARAAKPGATLLEIDKIAELYIRKNGGTPGFKGYHGFPGTLCMSVNDRVVHGIPTSYVLQEGDILAIDCGAKLDGWHGDTCLTVGVGQISEEAKRLILTTKEAMELAFGYCKVGYRLGDMSSAVQKYAEERGYSIVREYIGHGLGRELHEDPQVVFAEQRPGTGFRMDVGMTITIEPILNAGTHRCLVEPDGWTVRTADGQLSAQFEHTVAITSGEADILSLPDPELELA